MPETLMDIKGISKEFPGVKALSDVSFSIYKGEVRGLVGENGAGKSTLIKTIMGVHRQSAGEIDYYYDGKAVHIANPMDAGKKGLLADYQDIAVARELSITENFFMGRLLTKNGIVDWKTMHETTQKMLEEFGIGHIDTNSKISSLSLAKQAMVVICKLVNDNPRMIIFDEPTAVLTAEDSEILFGAIAKLKAKGVSILYISHRLEEILELCDNITVLKDGSTVGTYKTDTLDENKLIALMVGRDVGDMYNIKRAAKKEVVLRVKNLQGAGFKDISFDVKKGEIVGLFGLVGAGRTEIVRAIFGADKIESGSIEIDGVEFKKMTPLLALKNGLGLATEDRRNQGLATALSVELNINSASYDLISKCGIINLKKEKERALDYKEKMLIKTPTVKQLVKNLSGGNQQKVVLSKLLCRDPKVMIFDEPTVGIDVGAKTEIYSLIESLTGEGKAVIVISSYMPELMGLADRVLIITNGRISGEISREELNEELLLKYASNMM